MKKKQKLFLIFPVILITAILTGCVTVSKGTFSSEFIGTWERVDRPEFKSTLTFTSETIKASNQDYSWNASKFSGDIYMISQSNDPSNRGMISLKLIDGNLQIVDAYDAPTANIWIGTEGDWSGTWSRKLEQEK